MPRKLLVADDSVTIQRVVELMFADEDVDVVAVGDGRQAIERIEAEQFDIVLADVGMPERDGYEVAAFLKHTPRFSHIPVVLLTGAFESLDETRAREAGVDAVLAKPFEPSQAVTRVRELLEGKEPHGTEEAATSASTQSATPMPRGPLMAPRSADVLHEPRTASANATAADAPRFFRKDVEPERAEVADPALDAYFDRLDASFADIDATSPSGQLPREARSATEAWRAQDIDIEHFSRDVEPVAAVRAKDEIVLEPQPEQIQPGAGSFRDRPARPAAVPTVLVQRVRHTQTAAQPPAGPTPKTSVSRVPEVTVKSPPPLGDAFAALLAAEQAERKPGGVQTGAVAAPSPAVSDQLVEAVTRRVLERLTDRFVRDIVSETITSVTQRFVREEIQRARSRGGQ